jgi:CheY-like chemotaxis protein
MTLQFLVIDDEPNIREVLVSIIEHSIKGAEVQTAGTNEEAFRILESTVPALITTDIYRPGGTGMEFLTRLRTQPKHSFIPIIAISGQSNDAQQLSYYRHGFDAVVPKPFQTEDLITAINRLLRLRSDPALQLVHLGIETPSHDYKERIDLSSKSGRASLAKDVIAMTNSGGGTIVFGVAEPRPGEFVPQGLPEVVLASLETSRVNRAINDYVDPPVALTARRVQEGDQTFVLITVPPAKGSLALVKKQNDEAGLYPGRIYARTKAAESAEVRSSSELRELLEQLERRSR